MTPVISDGSTAFSSIDPTAPLLIEVVERCVIESMARYVTEAIKIEDKTIDTAIRTLFRRRFLTRSITIEDKSRFSKTPSAIH
jgi:hypothetical protein